MNKLKMDYHGAIYNSIDVQITLRCNARCPNCIKLCNSKRITGLNYSGMDMTGEHLTHFLADVVAIGGKVFDTVCVTGGEPLLHKNFSAYVRLLADTLLPRGLCNRLIVNTNQLLPAPPELESFMAPGSTPAQNPQIHNCAYLHPDDFPEPRPTYAGCTHYRKHTLVYNVQGYSVCCAGDGYIRLFRLQKQLCVPRLPPRLEGFPLPQMDLVCQHCPFGCKSERFERDLAMPLSAIYLKQGDKNKYAKIS